MTRLPLVSLFKIILDKKSALRFMLGTVFSLSFSVTVILSTIGLMDGYTDSLKSALADANGDIKFKARSGFFYQTDLRDELLKLDSVANVTQILQVEAFAIIKGDSKGVLVKGIDSKFGEVTGLKLNPQPGGLAIGSELAGRYSLEIGDSLVLAMHAKSQVGGTILREMKITQIVKHGIYEKDFRFVYLPLSELQDIVGYKAETVNLGFIKLKPNQNIEMQTSRFENKFREHFIFSPYWSEHEVLLDAVEIERNTISLALQLIVLVSVINIIAFMVFIGEVKSQDIFMLRALGLSMSSFKRFWIWVLFLIWGFSSLLALGLVQVVNLIILRLPFLQLPGDIYKLSQLQILLKVDDYLLVFGLSLVWVLVVGFFTLRKIQKKPLLSGLREEFS